jgi:hypothetical protein
LKRACANWRRNTVARWKTKRATSCAVAGKSLVDSIRGRVVPLGGIELELPPRDGIREPKDFDE